MRALIIRTEMSILRAGKMRTRFQEVVVATSLKSRGFMMSFSG